jgi:hypothetical protein
MKTFLPENDIRYYFTINEAYCAIKDASEATAFTSNKLTISEILFVRWY